MNPVHEFRFASVIRLERQLDDQVPNPVQPEMSNISEHVADLPGGGALAIRRFDPGECMAPAPAVVLFEPSANGEFPRSLDAIARRIAESAGLVVLGVTGRDTEGRLSSELVKSCWDWLVWAAEELGVDPTRVALGGRGETAGSVLRASSEIVLNSDSCPLGLILMCGDFGALDGRFVHLLQSERERWPAIYITTSASSPERIRSRRLSTYLLDRNVEHWLVEWPGTTARCLDHLNRVPEIDRYIDAMAVCLRALVVEDAREKSRTKPDQQETTP